MVMTLPAALQKFSKHSTGKHLKKELKNRLSCSTKKNRNLVVVDHRHPIVSRNLDFQVPYSRTQYHINSFSQEPSDPSVPALVSLQLDFNNG